MTKSSYPKFLYKFYSWNKSYNRDLIIHNQIYFSSVDKFNDPFENIVPIDYTNFDYKDWIERIIEINKSKGIYNNLSNNSITAHAISDYLEQVAKGRLQNLDEMNRLQYEYRKKYFAIFSMSATKKNILLWFHYSNSHKGICISYSTPELIKFIRDKYSEDGYEILLEKVDYYRVFPFFDRREYDDPRDFMIKSLVTKSSDWKYEKEYRLISNLNKINFELNLPEGIKKK